MTTLAAPSEQFTGHDVEERNAVVLENYGLVQRLANRVASTYGLPTGMEAADLVSHGVLGLVEAWERFDPDRGVPFEAYAVPRVRGAIVDAIRRIDWVPRKVRARARRLDEAQATLTNKLGRAPSRDELEEQVGSDATQTKRSRLPATLLALDSTVGGSADGDGNVVGDMLADAHVEQPGSAIMDAELRRQLMGALNRLNEREKLIVTLYYFQGVPLADIAKILGVTESRVSQLHMRALQTMRSRIDEEDQSA